MHQYKVVGILAEAVLAQAILAQDCRTPLHLSSSFHSHPLRPCCHTTLCGLQSLVWYHVSLYFSWGHMYRKLGNYDTFGLGKEGQVSFQNKRARSKAMWAGQWGESQPPEAWTCTKCGKGHHSKLMPRCRVCKEPRPELELQAINRLNGKAAQDSPLPKRVQGWLPSRTCKSPKPKLPRPQHPGPILVKTKKGLCSKMVLHHRNCISHHNSLARNHDQHTRLASWKSTQQNI